MEIEPFVRWLFEGVGLRADDYRASALNRRISACLRVLRVSSVQAARERIEQQPELIETALNAFLLGVTEFFRDPAVFVALARVLAEQYPQPACLRAWSAACSDGSELYSLAILLQELRMLEGSTLLGTDCRQNAIERARLGLFEASQMRFVQYARLARHFTRMQASWQINSDVKQATRFRASDVLSTIEPGPWDLILWRNHAIYLTPKCAADTWRALVKELRPGGILVTGRAERPTEHLNLSRVCGCIYRKSRSS